MPVKGLQLLIVAASAAAALAVGLGGHVNARGSAGREVIAANGPGF
jgi:hypothetical protein